MHRTIASAWVVALAAGCAHAPPSVPRHETPPVREFETAVRLDPVAAAPLAFAVLSSPLTDRDTRARVLASWTRVVPGLEALRDARVADAEAFLAQGAVAAATEVIHEAFVLERAVRAPAQPRTAGDVMRSVEIARIAAETTAAEAGLRARAAHAAGRFADAAETAAEARRLRQRAGLPADVGLAVLEGLAHRHLQIEAPPVEVSRDPPVVVAATPTPARRRSSPVRAAPAVAPPAAPDYVDAVTRARRQDDLAGVLSALRAARVAGASDPRLDALAIWAAGERGRALTDALQAAESAYVREDLERARAHWERALALDPENTRAREGLALYARFAALTR